MAMAGRSQTSRTSAGRNRRERGLPEMMRLKGRLARLEKALNPPEEPGRFVRFVFTTVGETILSEFTLDAGRRRNNRKLASSGSRLRGPAR
jgi:hypothetical protein